MAIDPSLVKSIKRSILSVLKDDEHGRVRISDPVRRQNEIRLVVDNFDAMNVVELMKKFPSKTRIFCRAVPRTSADVVLSRIEIYYFMESFWWKLRWVVLFVVWVVVPMFLSLASVIAYPSR